MDNLADAESLTIEKEEEEEEEEVTQVELKRLEKKRRRRRLARRRQRLKRLEAADAAAQIGVDAQDDSIRATNLTPNDSIVSLSSLHNSFSMQILI